MNYEIVNLKECTVAGLSARTNNSDPNMGTIIEGLWKTFYQKGIYHSIPNKCSGKAFGVYTDYETDENSDYTIMVACQVKNETEVSEGVVKHTIPAGKYAKFIVRGNIQTAVMEFWEELWKMDLPRNYTCDFEEYQDDNMENAEIHIYISLKS